MLITEIIWKEYFVEKFAEKHAVSVEEVEEAPCAGPVVRKIAKGRIQGEDVYAALSQIDSGRFLIVIFIYKKRGRALPISARDMNRAERRYYEEHK